MAVPMTEPRWTDQQTILDDLVSDGAERSFDQITAATGIKPWEMTLALAHLTAREAISSRVDLSTGRHVRLYRVAQ